MSGKIFWKESCEELAVKRARITNPRQRVCPLIFLIGTKNEFGKIYFFLNQSSPLIEDKFDDVGELSTIKEEILYYLKLKVTEELTLIKGKVVKSKYTLFNQDQLIIDAFVRRVGIVFPWQKKEVIKNTYESWIK